MADEELFDGEEEELEEELTPEFDEIETPPKKRSKIKLFLVFLLLLILAAATLFGLNRLGYVDLPINDYIPVDQLFEANNDAITVEAEIAAPQPLPPPPQLPEKKPGDTSMNSSTSAAMAGGYYLKVGSCLYKSCIKEITNKLKSRKLSVVKKESTQSTIYYELISEASYMKLRAEEKLRLLNKYNETIGFPYMLRTSSKRFIISFGQFPNKTTAIQMKSQLEHLYPQVRVRFLIRPKKDRTTITKLFVGPLKKQTAETVRMELRDSPDFEWVEIVKLP